MPETGKFVDRGEIGSVTVMANIKHIWNTTDSSRLSRRVHFFGKRTPKTLTREVEQGHKLVSVNKDPVV